LLDVVCKNLLRSELIGERTKNYEFKYRVRGGDASSGASGATWLHRGIYCLLLSFVVANFFLINKTVVVVVPSSHTFLDRHQKIFQISLGR
jgi:hypothetical protein